MLKDIFSKELITLNIEAIDWQDAIRKASQPLVINGYITNNYIEDMINGVKQYGPYIVLTKHVAMPHTYKESGAIKNAIGIATLKTPINFGSSENDPVKYLFPLSAIDNTSHLEAIVKLSELFKDEDFFKLLDNAKNPEEVVDYINK